MLLDRDLTSLSSNTGLFPLQEICERGKGQQYSQCQKQKCCGIDLRDGNGLRPPAPRQDEPRYQPQQNCHGTYAGERPCGQIKRQPSGHWLGGLCNHGKDAQNRAAGPSRQDGCRSRSVRKMISPLPCGLLFALWLRMTHWLFPFKWMVGPPFTGAYLLSIAPKNPATPTAPKATRAKTRTAVRTCGCSLIDSRYFVNI